MTLPKWSTFGIFVAIVANFLVSWVRAKHAEKGFRSALLPNALMAGGMSVVFVRDFFSDVPIWIDAPLAVLASSVILIALVLYLIKLKRFLINAWAEQEKE